LHPAVVVSPGRHTQCDVLNLVGTVPAGSEGPQGEQPVGSEHRGEYLNLEVLADSLHGRELSYDFSIDRYTADPKAESFQLPKICVLVKNYAGSV
jgi:hypothetical protein